MHNPESNSNGNTGTQILDHEQIMWRNIKLCWN